MSAQPPLALPMGEPRGGPCPPNASKSPGATRPLSHDTFFIFATAYALSVTAYAVPALPKGEPRGGRCPPNASKSPPGTPDTHNHPYPCITCINIPPNPQFTTPHPPANHPCRPPHPRSLPQATPPDPRKLPAPFALFCSGIAISCGKQTRFPKKMVHNKKLQNATNSSVFVHFLQIHRGCFTA